MYSFRSPRHKIGLDLASLDISRGRDHGLPPYVDLVKYCSKDELDIKTFEDLVQFNLMHQEEAEALQKNYKCVISLYYDSFFFKLKYLYLFIIVHEFSSF